MMEATIPIITEQQPWSAARMIQALNPRANCKAPAAGTINSDEISMTPTSFIAKTTDSPVNNTRIEFIKDV